MTNPLFTPPEFPLMYRAIGQVQGRFIPSQKKITQGVFLADDGLLLPAKLIHQAGWLAKKCPEKIQSEQIWSAYPHTGISHWFKYIQPSLPDDEIVRSALKQPPPSLWLELRTIRQPKGTQIEEEFSQGNNCFSIRGEIVEQNEREGKLTVRICRNKIPQGKEDDPFFQPSTLIVEGFLPGKVLGQFWDLDVSREGETLIIENGTYVADLSPPEPEPTPPPEPKQKQKNKSDREGQSEPKTPAKKTGKIIRLVK